MTEDEVRREIQIGFEYSYLHDDWVTPLEEALKGLTAEQALWKPSPDVKSIWEIVLHWAVWTENIVNRVRSREKARPSEGSWPLIPEVTDEAAWEAAKKRLWDAQGALRGLLETATLDEIQASPYGLADLLCRFTHNGYHIGQITKLREWMEKS